ncbi:MAG: hypothetical protein M5U01_05200 [Ardenticatenaceae bacterium]|nr:hypothetical protein [Ardenticatenaceae bacterium]HBY96925.1 hypothetical protein [Chloroflexota bacterium]
MALQFEVCVPGHLGEAAMVERVGVVEEPWMAGILHGREAPARRVSPFEAEHFQPGLAQIGLQDQTVVAGPENDTVVLF